MKKRILVALTLCLVVFITGCGGNQSPQEFTITLSANPTEGGTVNGGGKFKKDTVVNVTASANEGYTFVNWTEGETAVSADASYSFPVTKNRSLVANFSKTAPDTPAEQTAHTIGGVDFNMRLAPGGLTFPTGIGNTGSTTVDNNFWIAETEVTYELWYAVYTWATHEERGENRYYFADAGREGNHGDTGQAPTAKRNEPVTTVNWRAVIVWCNALTEYHNAQNGTDWDCVYTYDGQIVRDSRSTNATACDNVVADETANGFRLSTSMEWEMAARYIGPVQPTVAPLKDEAILMSGIYWTPGNYAGGATADYTNVTAAQEAAWYFANSGGSTQDVGQKPSTGNGLGLYDMSGNVWEWCFTKSGSGRVLRGGCWGSNAGHLQVGSVSDDNPSCADSYRGFRLVRTP